jgi:PEP-CTERM motif
MKKLALAAACLCAVSSPAMATVLPLNGGWKVDDVSRPDFRSTVSPWTFTLTNNAFFRLTDAFNAGDVYTAKDVGNSLTFVSTFTTDGAAVPAYFNASWNNTSYSRFSGLLGAGNYSFVVTGNCAGGCPAGFAVRLDTAPLTAAVPEPATWAMLVLGFGLIGAAMRRRSLNVTYAS